MMRSFYREGDNGSIYVGPNYNWDSAFGIVICYGRIDNPEFGMLKFSKCWEINFRLPLSVRWCRDKFRIEYGWGWRRRVRWFSLKRQRGIA